MGAVTVFNPSQLALIKKTVAKDCDDNEFNWFIKICEATRLDPLRRQIYAFVYNKDKADKRQLTPVVSIQGLRAIAARTGDYRPDDRAPRIEYDDNIKNADTNPLGIFRAEVTVYKHVHGSWHPCIGEAYWDEFAPIKEERAKDETGRYVPTGKRYLDTSKDGWRRMARLMIAKVAEAQALRKGWPDDFADLYEESEVDRHRVEVEATPAEMVQAAEIDDRFERIGGKSAIIVDWCDGSELTRVQPGEFADKCFAFIRSHEDDPSFIDTWRNRNVHALRDFWALCSGDALAVKKKIEDVVSRKRIPEKNEDVTSAPAAEDQKLSTGTTEDAKEVTEKATAAQDETGAIMQAGFEAFKAGIPRKKVEDLYRYVKQRNAWLSGWDKARELAASAEAAA